MHHQLRSVVVNCLALPLAVLAVAVLSPIAGAESFARGEFARRPYLQFASPHLMHVLWRTWGPITPAVRFGTDLNSLTQVAEGGAVVQRASLGGGDQPVPERWAALRTVENLKLPKLHSAPVGTFQYEARLSNLKPSTTYYYAVFDGSRRLTPADRSYSFTTPPPNGDRGLVRFAVLGDTGTGRLAQREVFDALMAHVRKSGQTMDFWVHVGDMAYGVGRDMEFQTRMFEPYEAWMRNTVCWPTMGNHEGYHSKGTTGIGPYYDAYAVPTRGEAGGAGVRHRGVLLLRSCEHPFHLPGFARPGSQTWRSDGALAQGRPGPGECGLADRVLASSALQQGVS